MDVTGTSERLHDYAEDTAPMTRR